MSSEQVEFHHLLLNSHQRISEGPVFQLSGSIEYPLTKVTGHGFIFGHQFLVVHCMLDDLNSTKVFKVSTTICSCNLKNILLPTEKLLSPTDSKLIDAPEKFSLFSE